ncbi:MAG: flagellar basal body P-ring protein FlgI [Planctomycetota bacterium]
MAPPEPPELIRDAVALRGMQPIRVDGVGLVNALAGTGGPVDPSPYREQLVDEMRRNSVPAPNEILESDTNSIVHVRASIPPGARRGDPIDLRVSSPPGSNVTDLQGGWLLDTRLRHQRLIAGRVRRGDVQGMATGAILTRAAFEGGEDESQKTEGVILGGGRVQKDLPMGLVIRPQYKHVEISKQIAKAINARFFFFDGATRRGVAKPVEDDFIELELHPRYEGALGRYVAVVRAIGVNQQQANQHERLQSLAELANNPATAADAALQLEALGESAVPTLLEIIKQDSDELRFYAAEALAYLDRQEAVPVLEELIARESAFRHPALAAMQRLKHPSVGDALHRLFDHPSIETRYGAMATLRRREELLHQLRPEKLGDALKLYQIESQAPPAIVVSVRSEPEIVLFGDTQPVAITKFVFGPSGIIIKPDASTGRLRISRFQVDKSDRRVVVASSVRDLIAGVVAVGGSYGDVVTVLRLAKSKGYIVDQLAIDPLPKPLRTYYRDEASEGETQDTDVEFTGSGV